MRRIAETPRTTYPLELHGHFWSFRRFEGFASKRTRCAMNWSGVKCEPFANIPAGSEPVMKRFFVEYVALILVLSSAIYPTQSLAAGPRAVQSLSSGKCVDLERGTTSDGPVVIQFDCHSGPNQQWSFVQAGGAGYRIVSQLSNKCIGIDRTGSSSSAAIVQSTCGAGASEQLWSLKSEGGGYVIKAIESELCLDVPGGSSVSGARLIAWRCTGRENQVWRLTP